MPALLFARKPYRILKGNLKGNDSQNKTLYLHLSLKQVTFDALVHISYANITIGNINWNVVLILWTNIRDHRIHLFQLLICRY